MSLETWKKEFYPVEAHKVSKEDAIEHSLQKWKGLSKENLELHGLVHSYSSASLYERDGTGTMRIGAGSCALCQHFIDDCDDCPLSEVMGGIPCDKKAYDEEASPWYNFVENGDPAPMIYWLEKAKVTQENP